LSRLQQQYGSSGEIVHVDLCLGNNNADMVLNVVHGFMMPKLASMTVDRLANFPRGFGEVDHDGDASAYITN
jgi:hypothetical protein